MLIDRALRNSPEHRVGQFRGVHRDQSAAAGGSGYAQGAGAAIRRRNVTLVSTSGDDFLTVAEIAASLTMNQQSIRNWIDSGYLPAIRIGRPVRAKRSDFDALLEADYTDTKQPPAGVMPAPVAPDENVEHEGAPPDAPGDAEET